MLACAGWKRGREGGDWVNRLHLTSMMGNKIQALFCVYFFQDVLHVCDHHVRNLKHNSFLALDLYLASYLLSLASYA